MHLLTLKRLTLHLTNPLADIVLKFYVVSLTSFLFAQPLDTMKLNLEE